MALSTFSFLVFPILSCSLSLPDSFSVINMHTNHQHLSLFLIILKSHNRYLFLALTVSFYLTPSILFIHSGTHFLTFLQLSESSKFYISLAPIGILPRFVFIVLAILPCLPQGVSPKFSTH